MTEHHDMPSAELQAAGRRAIGWIADYLSHPENYPVRSRQSPGELRRALPESAPREGATMDELLDEFERLIVPGVTHWNHPSFFAYFSITGSGPGIIGELLSGALNVNGMLWQTSPAATELEEVTLDWLRRLMGLPSEFKGVIMDTASVAVAHALAAARHARTDLDIRDHGLAGRDDVPRLICYTSEHAHSSVEKAAIFLGIGRENMRKIPVDSEFRMSFPDLRSTIEADRSAGALPLCVIATVGTTSTTSVDPVPAIADLCEQEGLWLHVDAAYAGMAALSPEHRGTLDGCERADSFTVNPHKWLFTPIDCSAFYVRDPEGYRDAFSLLPEYLRTDVGDEVTNYMDWGIALGRRFRALKLWMVMRYFGADRLAAEIRRHMKLAKDLAAWIEADPDFQIMAPVPFGLVCFRARPGGRGSKLSEGELDAFNEKLLKAVNATGKLYISHTRLNDRYVLRFAIGNLRTTEDHVRDGWELIRRTSAELFDARD